MGATLLLTGLGLLYAQINERTVLDWAAQWWPLVFIFLGVEVLWQAYQAKKANGRVSYDILSVFMVGLLLCFGLAMQALSETGVIEQCRTMLTAQNYELQQNAGSISVDTGLKEIVVEAPSAPLEIFSAPTNKISASVDASVTAGSRNAALKLLAQSQGLEKRREGDTLYIAFASGSPISDLSPGMGRQKYSLYLPQQLKVTVHSETSDLEIHARDISNDWYIKGAQSVNLDLPATANLQLAAQVNSRDELQGNAAWQVKEAPPADGSNAEYAGPFTTAGSLTLGSGQHKMTINSNGLVKVDLLP